MIHLPHAVAAVLGLAFVALLSGCPHPLPPPVAPDAGASDATVSLFYGKSVDCTERDTTLAQPYALTCADVENTNECLENYVKTGVPLALMACAARDVEVTLFGEVAKGTATATTRDRAARLRAWYWAQRMTLRGAP
jgi:hypothetical protein